MSLLRDPECYELLRSVKRKRGKANKDISGHQLPKHHSQTSLPHKFVLAYENIPCCGTSDATSQLSQHILENVLLNKQDNEAGGSKRGHPLQRSVSDICFGYKGSCSSRALKKSELQNRSESNITKPRNATQIYSLSKTVKEIVQQIIKSSNSYMDFDQLLCILIQVMLKMEGSGGSNLMPQCVFKKKGFNDSQLRGLLTQAISKITESHKHCDFNSKMKHLDLEKSLPTKSYKEQIVVLQEKKGSLNMQLVDTKAGNGNFEAKVDGSGLDQTNASENDDKKDENNEKTESSSSTENVVEQLYINNATLLPVKEYTSEPKLRVIETDDTIVKVDQVMRQERLMEEMELEKFHNIQRKLLLDQSAPTHMIEKPICTILRGLDVIKNAESLECVSQHLRIMRTMLVKWPHYLLQTAEIMKHVIATIEECNWVERISSRLPYIESEPVERVLNITNRSVRALEFSENIQKTSKELLMKIDELKSPEKDKNGGMKTMKDAACDSKGVDESSPFLHQVSQDGNLLTATVSCPTVSKNKRSLKLTTFNMKLTDIRSCPLLSLSTSTGVQTSRKLKRSLSLSTIVQEFSAATPERKDQDEVIEENQNADSSEVINGTVSFVPYQSVQEGIEGSLQDIYNNDIKDIVSSDPENSKEKHISVQSENETEGEKLVEESDFEADFKENKSKRSEHKNAYSNSAKKKLFKVKESFHCCIS